MSECGGVVTAPGCGDVAWVRRGISPKFRLQFSPKKNIAMKIHFYAGLLVLLSMITPAAASGLDQYLVARWTFNNRSLKSDRGDFVLRKLDIGREPTLEFIDGAARLGPGTLLVCDALNSSEHPALKESVTLWARVWIDSTVQKDCFLFGLRNHVPAGDWKNMTLVAMGRPEPINATGFFSTLRSGAQVASGSRGRSAEPGRFVSLGLVFDGMAKSVTYVVDGKPVVSGHREAVSLADFSNFAIGRLKEAYGVSMTLDEVRVYSIALPSEWVADIKPVQ